MVKANMVAAFVEKIAPLELGFKGDENGFIFGDPYQEVKGIATCWSPTLEIIKKTTSLGFNMIISHERLIYEYTKFLVGETQRTTIKLPNRLRFELLIKSNIVVYRCHTNWDAAKGGIIDSLLEHLGYSNSEVERREAFAICEIEPVTARELAESVKGKLGLEIMKVVGNLKKKVKRIGLVGGGSLSVYHFVEEAYNCGCDLFLGGDLVEEVSIFANECGMILLDGTHGCTENYGMISLAERLKKEFPTLQVQFLNTGKQWDYI